MSKASRRRPRTGIQPSTARPAGSTPKPSTPSAAKGGGVGGSGSTTAPGASGAAPGPTATTTATASTGTSSRPLTSTRAGRRERARTTAQPSFAERYRAVIVAVAAVAAIALISLFVFRSASNAAYACTNVWSPAPTASPAAGATPNLGYVQPDQGRTHDKTGLFVTYTYCAPASGAHYNAANVGPITPRVYGPNDVVIPQGWIHNLEHGAMIILYRGDSEGATAAGQLQLRALYDAFPPGPVCGTPKGVTGPVIARFDQMSTPFQALLWGRVLLLETLDQAEILAFWAQWGERTNPERLCPFPTPSRSPATSASPAPSAGESPAASPSPAQSASPSPAQSASPSPAASESPAATPAPSASPSPS